MRFHHKSTKRPCFLKMPYLGPYTFISPNTPFYFISSKLLCSFLKTLYLRQTFSYNLIFFTPIFTPISKRNALIQFTKTLSFGQNSPNSLIFRVFRVNRANDLFPKMPPLASEFGPKFSWKLKPITKLQNFTLSHVASSSLSQN